MVSGYYAIALYGLLDSGQLVGSNTEKWNNDKQDSHTEIVVLEYQTPPSRSVHTN